MVGIGLCEIAKATFRKPIKYLNRLSVLTLVVNIEHETLSLFEINLNNG